MVFDTIDGRVHIEPQDVLTARYITEEVGGDSTVLLRIVFIDEGESTFTMESVKVADRVLTKIGDARSEMAAMARMSLFNRLIEQKKGINENTKDC